MKLESRERGRPWRRRNGAPCRLAVKRTFFLLPIAGVLFLGAKALAVTTLVIPAEPAVALTTGAGFQQPPGSNLSPTNGQPSKNSGAPGQPTSPASQSATTPSPTPHIGDGANGTGNGGTAKAAFSSDKPFAPVGGTPSPAASAGDARAMPSASATEPVSKGPVALPVDPLPGSTSQKPAYGLLHHYTFTQYLDAVMARNPSILSAQLDAVSADYTWRSVRNSYFPALTATAQTGLLNGVGISPFVNQGSNFGNRFIHYGLFDDGGGNLQFPLYSEGTFLGITTPPKAKMKLEDRNISSSNVILTRNTIRFRAAQYFLQALTNHQEEVILNQKVAALNKQGKVVLAEFPYHIVSQDQVDAANLQLEQAKTLLNQAQWLDVYSFEKVSMMLGIDDPREVQIDTTYPTLNAFPEYTGLLNRVLMAHPELEIQKATLAKAMANKALATSAFFPTAKILGTYAYGDNYDPPGTDQWEAVMQVSLPIFDWGSNYFTERAASVKVEAEKKRLWEVKEDLSREIHDDFDALEKAHATYLATKVALSQRFQLYEKERILGESGQTAMLTLIQSQANYLDALGTEEAAHYDMLLTYAALERDSSSAYKCDWDQTANTSPEISRAARPPAVMP